MPWGYSGGYREPAPRRLTLEDLLGEDYSPTARPSPISDVGGLSPEEQRRVRMQSVLTGLGAFGGLLQGDRRAAMAGMGQMEDIRAQALDEANRRQEAEWQAGEEQRAAELQNQQRRQQKGALFGMYEEVAAGETPDFAARAEAAARAGSMAELEKMREQKPMRAAARAKGYDPDAWDTRKKLEEELAAELERAKAAAAWEEEKKRLPEKGRIESDAEVAKKRALRDAGLLWEPNAPAGPTIPTTREFTDGTTRQYNPATKQWDVIATKTPGETGGAIDAGRWQVIPEDRDSGRPAYRVNVETGVVRPIDKPYDEEGKLKPEYQPRSVKDQVNDIQNVLGRHLTTAEKQQAEADLGRGVLPRQLVAAFKKSQVDATKKLSVVSDPGLQQKIKTARANGYSDSEIASFLGIH